MMRAFKVIRQFKELRMMITGLLNCSRPLLWASVLMACLTYMTAVFISQFLSEYLRSLQGAIPEEDGTIIYIRTYFPDMLVSMYTLFEALTGGRDWGEIAEPFRRIHWLLVVCLSIYIIIGVFCLLNLLTAVFLEAAHRLDDVQDLVYAKRDWVKEVKDFFFQAVNEVEKDNLERVERITKNSFIKLLKSRRNVKVLEENGVDLSFTDEHRLGEIFDIMDEDGNGSLDVDEFVQSLYLLKGPARALDLKLDSHRASKMFESLQGNLRGARSI
jgi:Ca2+-binding EF-hand superfamily protein